MLSIYNMISVTVPAVDLNIYNTIFQKRVTKCFLKIKFY